MKKLGALLLILTLGLFTIGCGGNGTTDGTDGTDTTDTTDTSDEG